MTAMKSVVLETLEQAFDILSVGYIYAVGGAVRDSLLRKEPKDVDLVVTHVLPKEMIERGFVATGKSFPVFRHDKMPNVEFALARGERKNGIGHSGFDFFLTNDLTEDLRRRDFTVNAMAFSAAFGLVDPFGGQKDLQAMVLRHVSPAFAEDPERCYRAGKFAARGFSVAEETKELMRTFKRKS